MGTSNRCRYCGRQIRWAKTVNGKPIPLDLHTDPKGNIMLHEGIANVVGQSDDPADVRHMAHFVTCPNNPHRK